MKRYIITFLFLCLYAMARGQTGDSLLYYWFDSEHESLYSGSLSNGQWQQTIDVSQLQVGLHTFYAMTIDDKGRVSSPVLRQFYKIDQSGSGEKLRCLCYVDGMLFSEKEVSAEGGVVSLDLDASMLSEGMHRIQLQVYTESGTVSGVYNGFFIRVVTKEELSQFLCLCYVDGELYSQKKMPADGGLLHLDFDASSLSEGLHSIQFQVLTETGLICGVYNGFFTRVATSVELNEYYCMYALDDDTEGRKVSKVGHDGTFHFDLDMTEISDGLHHISYFLSSDKGASSSPQTRFFIKLPNGGNAISMYQYWLNDDFENTKTVYLPTVQNPLKLITMLPLETQPLRSSLFHFEVKDGQPMMYGKNDFHVRFYDASNRFVDASKTYIDYNVGQEVTDIETLEPGITATTDKPEENAVKWYQLTAERGDSLSFKTDIACTIQLFAPSGTEVYQASGSDVVKWGGCQAPEPGTFYLALHDVTDQEGPTVSIDYQQYDVLRGDVNGDGVVNVADIGSILNTMAKGTYNVHADSNCDGVVNVADIANVLTIMASRARAEGILLPEEQPE